MTNEQIFTKAIEKAIARGWDMDGCADLYKSRTAMFPIHVMDHPLGITDGGSLIISAYEIIFDHDFARALWGEEIDTGDTDNERQIGSALVYKFTDRSWQAHLQRMVIARDRVAYLGENL